MTRKKKQIADIHEAARESTSEALQVLKTICSVGQDDLARVAAATALLDLGHGTAVNPTRPAVERIEASPAALKQR